MLRDSSPWEGIDVPRMDLISGLGFRVKGKYPDSEKGQNVDPLRHRENMLRLIMSHYHDIGDKTVLLILPEVWG